MIIIIESSAEAIGAVLEPVTSNQHEVCIEEFGDKTAILRTILSSSQSNRNEGKIGQRVRCFEQSKLRGHGDTLSCFPPVRDEHNQRSGRCCC